MKTLCPQCGFDVKVDEDGCCVSCGNGAIGDGVNDAHRERAKAVRLRIRVQNLTSGPCPSADDGAHCELRFGHAGDHRDGGYIWSRR